MKRVWKYPIPIQDYVLVPLPKGAKILCAKVQKGGLNLWALVDSEEPETEDVTIRIAGTDHPIEEPNLEYIDTVLMYQDTFVIHIFKVIK